MGYSFVLDEREWVLKDGFPDTLAWLVSLRHRGDVAGNVAI